MYKAKNKNSFSPYMTDTEATSSRKQQNGEAKLKIYYTVELRWIDASRIKSSWAGQQRATTTANSTNISALIANEDGNMLKQQ